jgi:glycosyltransferase involved in cell wall biosynthesis
MRITLVAPLVTRLRAAQAGGAQVVLSQLARALVGRGEEVTVVAAPGSVIPGVRVRSAGAGPFPDALVHGLPQPARGAPGPDAARGADAWSSLQATAYLGVVADLRRAPLPQAVHAHALDWPAFYALAAAGLPTVHTLHLGPLDPAAAAAARAAARTSPRPRFVAVSRACARQWRGVVPVDAVIGNGADPAAIPFRASPEPDLALVAGRIAPEKGTHLAVAAALRAGLRVALAGGVYDRGYFDEQVSPLLSDRVKHLGPVTQRRLAGLYGRAAVVLCASLWEEPFGMVALEANLAGTPVAGFARGALPEVVGRAGGVLSEQASVTGLVRAIRAAVCLDRAAVRRAAARRHPLERMVDGYLDIYRELAAAG